MNHRDHAEVYSTLFPIEYQLSVLRRYFEQMEDCLAMLWRIEMDATGSCELADSASDDLHDIAVRLFAHRVVDK